MMNKSDRFVLLVQTMCICERALPMSPGDAPLVLGDAMAYDDSAFFDVDLADAAAEWWGWRRYNASKPKWLEEWEEATRVRLKRDLPNYKPRFPQPR